MGPGERIELKKKIAEALAQRPGHEIDLILREFNQPTSEFGSWADDAGYILDMLTSAGVDDLQAIADYLLGASQGHVPAEAGPWSEGRFKLFFSHLYEHREFVTNVKTVLGWQGIDCFVAHTDIKPSREWVAEIELALWTCDGLAAFLHDGFAASNWCDQEVGFVVGARKPILPLMMTGETPHGFLSKYQAVKCRDQTPHQVAQQVFQTFFDKPETRPAVVSAQIAALRHSPNFDTSNTIARRLRDVMVPDDWTPERLDHLEASLENAQVAAAYDAEPWITQVLKDHRAAPPPAEDDDVPF